MSAIEQMQLSRRERQIMDILFEQGECSAQQVLAKMEDAPGYSAVRALIARLVDKGVVEFRISGTKHIYRAKIAEEKAQSSAVQRLLKTFFKGSKIGAVNALLDMEGEALTARELAQLERKIAHIKLAQEKNK